MKKIALVVTLFAASTSAFAETAPVVSVQPNYQVTHQNVCNMVEVQEAVPVKERSYLGGGVGGVAGGLLGSQVGGGNGNKAATVVGAVGGAVVGDRTQNGDDGRSPMGAIIGGLAGGLLGSQVGGGNGNKVAMATGAVVGAAVGDNMQHGTPANAQPQYRTVQKQVCHIENVNTISSYNVKYRLGNEVRSTTMNRDPGRYVDVSVVVSEARTATAPW